MCASQTTGNTNRRALIQWCMSSQLFTEASLKEALARIYTEEAAADLELPAEIEQINTTLALLSLQIRSAMDQHTGDRLYALVNTNADKISTGATPYTATELSMLKHLIELIFTSTDGNYAVDLHTATRAISSLGAATFARRDAQDLIDRMCTDGWLEKTEESGYVVVGQRALIELQSYFNDGFGDYVRFCSLCKEMATCGLVCNQCEEPVHPFCADQILKSVGSLSCPKCHQPMSDAVRFGASENGVSHNLVDTPQAVRDREMTSELAETI